jgi:type II secretory pathway pseudopilin PulG
MPLSHRKAPPSRLRRSARLRRRLDLRRQEGFTMLVAIGVLLVASLLVAAAFAAAEGDIALSRRNTTARQAYYAALAGIQQYEYQLEINPDYWEKEGCERPPEGTVAKEPAESYVDKVLLSAEAVAANETQCNPAKPFQSMIEKGGAAGNTFRIESTGTVANANGAPSTHSIVATFKVTGFLNYIYFTQYEDEDPSLSSADPSKACEKYYAEQRSSSCTTIVFVTGDEVNGPMHTDDAPAVCGRPEFGRKGHAPADVIEFGHEPYQGGCETMKPVYNTASKSYIIGPRLEAPQSDASLERYIESEEDEFEGSVHLVMNGASNTIAVTKANGEKTSIPWPSNGLIYVRNASTGCSARYEPEDSDNAAKESEEASCGDVYVGGDYSQSLTIGAANDVIIDSSLYPVTSTGTPATTSGAIGGEPTGTATLGLIANNYVRVYHPMEEPCEEVEETKGVYNYKTKKTEYITERRKICHPSENGIASLPSPWIYAGILSTDHSFLVDNYGQGKSLGKLNVYGAIAQKFRGPVGTTGGSGYIKNYLYDERLAVDEPPYFLNPLNAGWKVIRETAAAEG